MAHRSWFIDRGLPIVAYRSWPIDRGLPIVAHRSWLTNRNSPSTLAVLSPSPQTHRDSGIQPS
ncbi:MAG: hypothetical protein VKK80_14750 [Prochlorothrix sp.]|nr:hypothetical protein [Prochlorothrix sp.]